MLVKRPKIGFFIDFWDDFWRIFLRKLKTAQCLVENCSAHRRPTETGQCSLERLCPENFKKYKTISVGSLWAEQLSIKHWAVFSFLKKIRQKSSQKSMKNLFFGLLTSIGGTPSPFPLFWDITQLLTLKIVDFIYIFQFLVVLLSSFCFFIFEKAYYK